MEREKAIAAASERILETSAAIGARFVAEFERLSATDPKEMRDPRWGFIEPNGDVNFDRAPIKYAINATAHLRQKIMLLPHFEGAASVFDIGTGPCQLAFLLQAAFGIDVTGVDDNGAAGAYLYRAFREAYGLQAAIADFHVTFGTAIPILDGVEVVSALFTVFDIGWDVEQHEWFVNECRSRGARKLVWRMNRLNASEQILAFHESNGAIFPWPRDKTFFILDLTE